MTESAQGGRFSENVLKMKRQPQRTASNCAGQISPAEWSGGVAVAGFSGQLEVYMKKFEDPKSSDPMSRLQSDFDETKIVLVSRVTSGQFRPGLVSRGLNSTFLLQHNTIEAVLERGEKLDDLVDKSEALSMQSKTFYKTARKTNSCCGTSWG